MPSERPASEVASAALLDAARASILAVGWRRSTLTDVARRAGVSRMTIYRRWPDMQALVADLMTREWAAPAAVRPTATALTAVVAAVTGTVRALRADELFTKIRQVDPELLLPYLLDRRGRTHDALLSGLEGAIADGQAAGTVRAGDPVLLARAVLLTAQGFLCSAATMTDPDGPSLEALDVELGVLLERYLAP